MVRRIPIGIVVNGVTGRMGYRQHLVRSLLAIREQGGLDLGDGTRAVARAVLVGRREHALRALAERARPRPRGRPTSTRSSPTRPSTSTSTPRSPPPARRRIREGRSPPASTSTPRSRPPTGLDGALELARARRAPPASSTASCRTSCSCPGLLQAEAADRRRLLRPDPVRARRVRLLGLRGRLAERPAPVLELPRRGRRRHRRRHVPALASTCCDELFGRSRSVQAHDRHPHPAALGRAGQAVRRHRRRRRLRHLRARGRRRSPRSTPPGRCASTATSWSSSRSTAPTARAVAGLRNCRVQHRGATPQAGLEPGPPGHRGLPRPVAGGARTTSEFDNGFKAQWELFLRHVVADAPFPLGPARRRPRRAARRAGPEVLGRGPPPRRAGALAVTIRLPAPTAGCGPTSRARTPSPSDPPARPSPPVRSSRPRTSSPTRTRTPRPDAPAAVDWDATLAFRRHLWSHGLGVAEAMDTAQRGMGLDWAGRGRADPPLRPPRRRPSAGRIACGVGTDQLARARPRSREVARRLRGAARARRGGRRAGDPDGLPRARRRRRAAPRTTSTSTATCCARPTEPVILHWLGPDVRPGAGGLLGLADLDAATDDLPRGHRRARRTRSTASRSRCSTPSARSTLRRRLPGGRALLHRRRLQLPAS